MVQNFAVAPLRVGHHAPRAVDVIIAVRETSGGRTATVLRAAPRRVAHALLNPHTGVCWDWIPGYIRPTYVHIQVQRRLRRRCAVAPFVPVDHAPRAELVVVTVGETPSGLTAVTCSLANLAAPKRVAHPFAQHSCVARIGARGGGHTHVTLQRLHRRCAVAPVVLVHHAPRAMWIVVTVGETPSL